jgi:hypothetical protein
MTSESNLNSKFLINLFLLFSFGFAAVMVTKTVAIQNATNEKIDKVELRAKNQCSEWMEKNGSQLLAARKEEVKCN